MDKTGWIGGGILVLVLLGLAFYGPGTSPFETKVQTTRVELKDFSLLVDTLALQQERITLLEKRVKRLEETTKTDVFMTVKHVTQFVRDTNFTMQTR